jgi:peroxiredoxin
MSTPTVREQFLVISALGANPMELTNVLCRASHENRCAVVTSRLTRHGECSALVLQISGSWDALARLETGLPGLAKKHDFTVNVVRSAALENRPQALPYVAYVSSAYRSDIVNELCQFFIDHNVELENLTCDTYQAPQTGQTFSLAALKGKQVVIYFYPKDSTPGCTTEGQGFRDQYAAFKAANTEVFGVSRDSVKSHENFKAKQEFPFELISDKDEAVCQLFDVIKLKKLYGKEYLGVDRSTFLIDKDGVLRQEWRGVKVPGHVDAVLAAAQALNKA